MGPSGTGEELEAGKARELGAERWRGLVAWSLRHVRDRKEREKKCVLFGQCLDLGLSRFGLKMRL